MLGFFSWEAWRVSARPITPEGFARSLCLTIAGLACVCGFSGGPESPFLPILFAPVGIGFAAFGVERLTRQLLTMLALAIAYIALSSLLFDWPPIRAPHVHVMLLLATAVSTTLLYFGVTGLASAYRTTAVRLERLRFDTLESAAQRSTELEALGSRVAHEIKNPLSSIKGLVQLVYDGFPGAPAISQGAPEPDRTKLRLGTVLSEVSRVEQVLKDYLNFARPVTALRRRRLRVDQFLGDFLELVSGEAERAHVSLSLESPAFSAEFDPDKLKQALLNLAQNALRAMPRGGRLELTAQGDQHSWQICVRDTGCGMDATDLAQLKKPYFSRGREGSGLGVVIANGVVTQHGGTLSFQSAPGSGTTVTIELPQVGAA
jgi:signal transduction histidine kinase